MRGIGSPTMTFRRWTTASCWNSGGRSHHSNLILILRSWPAACFLLLMNRSNSDAPYFFLISFVHSCAQATPDRAGPVHLPEQLACAAFLERELS